MQLPSQVQLFTPYQSDTVPLEMAVYHGPCAAQGILVLDLDDAVLLSQVGCEVPCSPSMPPTAEG